jgi:hypothetical protein
MNKTSYQVKRRTLIGLAMLMALFSGTASADWLCAHGTTARVHDPDLIDEANLEGPSLYFVWGVGYAQVPNATNWLIFPIPTGVPTTTRRIAVEMETLAGGDIYVDRVAVWNRAQKLSNDLDVNWSGARQVYFLDIGADHDVQSMSISLRTQTGDFGGRLRVTGVCAQSLPAPSY